MTLAQTYQQDFPPGACCVRRPNDSRVLQFALLIAVRCVLHRYGNQDIHRRKFSFCLNGIRSQVTFLIRRSQRILRSHWWISEEKHQGVTFGVNDPSAGSPTETLLRLLLPLSDKVYWTSFIAEQLSPDSSPEHSKSVGATGGVYKGQGRNRHKIMTCAY